MSSVCDYSPFALNCSINARGEGHPSGTHLPIHGWLCCTVQIEGSTLSQNLILPSAGASLKALSKKDSVVLWLRPWSQIVNKMSADIMKMKKQSLCLCTCLANDLLGLTMDVCRILWIIGVLFGY